MQLEAFIAHYGLIALCVGAGVEGETMVVLGGIFAHRGSFSLEAAIIAAAGGSFIADQLFFLIGRRFRQSHYVAKLRRRPVYRRAARWFDRHPVAFVFGFRFVYGMRTVSPLAIGTTTMPAWRFALLNALAAILWATIFVSLGYAFGAGIEAAFGRLHDVERVILPFIGAAIVVALAIWLIRRHHAAASAASTGPAPPGE